jgi:phage portal protein BeeE
MGSYDFRRLMQVDLLLRGNAYALLVTGADGYARELWRLHPDRTDPVELPDLSIVYRYRRADGKEIVFAEKEILHLRDISVDGIKGLSRISLAREAIGLALRGEEHGARTLKHGASLKLVFAEEGLTAVPVGMTNADAEWLEARRYQVSEIAGMFFGIPPHLMGDQKQTNWGTGIEQQNIGMHQYTLLPETRLWEEGLNRKLLKPADKGRLYFKLNASAYLRASAKDRGEFYSRALGAGGGQAWMTPDEVRELDELPPIAGGGRLPDRPGVARAGTSEEQ